MKNFLAVIGVLVVASPAIIVLTIIVTAWRAWWFYPAWAWYVAPLGLPQISFWHFAALMLLVGGVRDKIDAKENDRKTSWATVVVSYLWPIAVWTILRWMR